GWTGNDSLVIALYGSWGSGKSSVKNMILEALREQEQGCPLIVEFNPWQWAGQAQLAEAFFQEIGVVLGRSDTNGEGKERAAKWRAYGTYLTLGASLAKSLKTVLPLLGIPGSSILELLASGLEKSSRITREGSEALSAQAEAGDRNLTDVKQDLANSLKALKEPILVVIDDVDRLSTDEIKLLFQLVKANADFPNLVYLLLFQRDIVEKSLETITSITGREFLEKIVQVGFDIPRIEHTRLEKVLFAGLEKLLGDETVRQRFNQQRWGNIFIPGLRPYLETLRDVHRFLATLSFHVALFRNSGSFEVNPIDLIALEVMRVFEPAVYHGLPEAKSALTEQRGRGLHGRGADDITRRVVESLVEQASEANRPQVREILKQLFPPTQWVFGGPGYGPGSEERWYRDLRVCHPDVFDRYFHFTIPEGDISQAELDRLLSLLSDREGLVAEFRALGQRGLLSVTLDRIEAYKEEIDLQHAVPFITALFDIGDELPDEPTGFFSIGPDMHAVRIIHWYLKREKDTAERSRLLKEAMKASSGIYLPVKDTSFEDHRKAESQIDPDSFLMAEADVKDMRQICIEKIQHAAKSGALKTHPKMAYLLSQWWKWASPEEPRRWIEGLIESEDGFLAFLTSFLQRSTSQGVGDYVTRISWHIHLKDLENFVSAEDLENKVKELSPVNLGERKQKAVGAVQEALRRRQKGENDEDWPHEHESD
ncbi:MAG: AAA family ATPase, partial [Deltaproteobacteria bacterium]|nr:AAA family ATPase [Deltaproteobacteria bacterium]